MLLKFAKRVLRDKQRQVQDMLVQLVLMANIKKIHIHMSTIVQRVLRDKQRQVQDRLVQLVSMANIKEQPHQLSTIVQYVIRERQRQLTVPQQVAQLVLRENSKN